MVGNLSLHLRGEKITLKLFYYSACNFVEALTYLIGEGNTIVSEGNTIVSEGNTIVRAMLL